MDSMGENETRIVTRQLACIGWEEEVCDSRYLSEFDLTIAAESLAYIDI